MYRHRHRGVRWVDGEENRKLTRYLLDNFAYLHGIHGTYMVLHALDSYLDHSKAVCIPRLLHVLKLPTGNRQTWKTTPSRQFICFRTRTYTCPVEDVHRMMIAIDFHIKSNVEAVVRHVNNQSP